MVPRSRRTFLRTSAAAFAVLGAGCLAANDDVRTPANDTPTSVPGSPTVSETPEPTDEFPPDVDERVDERPPGSPALTPSGEWPSYRYDAGNTGANPEGTGLRDGTTYWRLNAGGSATVANDRLYNVFDRNQSRSDLTVRDPSTAKVTTRTPLVEYGINGPPVVADGRVYVTTFIEVFCFDAESGEQLWRGPEMDGIQGRPTVADDQVLVNSGGFDSVDPHLRAFDAESGEELWRYATDAESKATPAVGDGLVFVSSTAGLHAVERTTGEEAFVLAEEQYRWATPAFHDGVVYSLASGREESELLAVDTDDHTVQWRAPVENESPPVVTEEVVYASGADGLVALDPEDGEVVRSATPSTRPLGLVGEVLYGAAEGGVYAFDGNNLDLLWSIETENVQISDTVGRHVYHVTPVDGAVFVSARDAFYGIGSPPE